MSEEETSRPERQETAGAATPEAPPSPGPAADPAKLEADVVEAIKTCYDPEIPINIHELGLISKVEVSPQADVLVEMTLTSPACPVAGSLPPEVEAKVRGVPGVAGARVEVVWEPPWNPDMMSEAARLQLGM